MASTWQDWLFCQTPTITYAPKTNSEAPVASPSSPSVRFTALDHAVMRKFAQTTNRTSPTATPANARSTLVSRMNEIRIEAGVRKCRLGNCRAAMANVMPTRPCPTIFASGDSPRLRCREILMKSSRNPTSPSPVMRYSTSPADTVGFSPVMSRPPAQPSTVAVMMTRPPIVGVPRLVKCAVGPSCRMNWPYCRLTRNRTNSGVPSREMSSDSPPARSSAFIDRPPAAGRPGATGRRRTTT